MELNLFNVGSLWFPYSIKRLCQVQNFKMKLQSYAPFNKVMSYFVAFFEETNMNAILAGMSTIPVVVIIRPENIQARIGFQPMICAIPVQRSTVPQKSWFQIPYGPKFFQAVFSLPL